jgi:hypothetical protein
MKYTLRSHGTTRVVRRALIAACSSLVFAAIASGCSSSSPSSSVQTTVLKPGAIVKFDLAHNARTDVTTKGCEMTGGSWVLKGTVTNPGPNANGFQIVVDFVTSKGYTVVSTTEIEIPTVGPKASTQWSAAGAKGKSGITCLVRQAQTI